MFTKYSNEKTEKPFLTETKQSLSVFVLIIIRLFVFIKKINSSNSYSFSLEQNRTANRVYEPELEIEISSTEYNLMNANN